MSTDIRDVALRKLSTQARTEGEIRKYLFEKGFDISEINDTIDFLKEYSYLNDESYCKEYYIYSMKKGKGRIRIEQELNLKGVDGQLIKKALDELMEDPEIDMIDEEKRAMVEAEKLLKNHLESRKTADDNFLGKVARRLCALGYGTDTVYRVIGKVRDYKETDYE